MKIYIVMVWAEDPPYPVIDAIFRDKQAAIAHIHLEYPDKTWSKRYQSYRNPDTNHCVYIVKEEVQ